ncbi:MAG: PHP domain-containing protein [Methanotrichaceae archaeon]|nr:PHP domain-containing protein [Methanotrichaceae archaeon]
MRLIKGVIHVHSQYSYDGTLPLKTIKNYFKERGFNFIIFTEHENKMGDDWIDLFVSECKSASEEDFIIIPGIEFKYEDIEILGLNLNKNIYYNGIKDLIKKIKINNGLAVLAHPKKYKYNFKNNLSILKELNGIEIWNCRYDGRHVPRVHSIKLLNLLRNENIFGYAGLDYHYIGESTQPYHQLYVKELTIQEIMENLKNGNYNIINNNLEIDSRANLTFSMYIIFLFKNYLYLFFKFIFLLGENFFHRLGRPPPKFMVQLARKIIYLNT